MPHMLIRHKVKSFANWKSAFDEHASVRKAAGSKGGILFRSAEDPNEVVILFQWSDLGAARKFAQSENLREVMKDAGVVGQPDIFFVEELERPTV